VNLTRRTPLALRSPPSLSVQNSSLFFCCEISIFFFFFWSSSFEVFISLYEPLFNRENKELPFPRPYNFVVPGCEHLPLPPRFPSQRFPAGASVLPGRALLFSSREVTLGSFFFCPQYLCRSPRCASPEYDVLCFVDFSSSRGRFPPTPALPLCHKPH